MKFTPSTKPTAKKPPLNDEGDGNALWRIPEWFPELDESVLQALKLYHSELLKFNLKINLISRNTERQADIEHFADSVLASQLLLKENLGPRVYDIGSGNGFPAVILAVMDPSREYVLVESDTRKCEFLKHAIHLLCLKNMKTMNVRFETLVSEGMSVALSRGFASISKTVLMCNKIFSKDGRFYHLKGPNWSSEIAQLPSQLISLWKPDLIGEYNLPVTQLRRAIVLTKKTT